MIRALAAMLVASALLAATDAQACTWVVPKSQPVYFGGDLMTQIAAKAHTLQVVRVASRTRLKQLRGSRDGSRAFNFTLEPIMTLHSRATLFDRLIGFDFRKATIGVNAWSVTSADLMPYRAARQPSLYGMLPAGMLDAYPTYYGGEDTIPYAPGAVLGVGGCAQPELRLAVGDLFIAARRSDGALYETSVWGERHKRLMLDLRQFDEPMQQAAPSLIRIESLRDPVLLRLQKAIAAEK